MHDTVFALQIQTKWFFRDVRVFVKTFIPEFRKDFGCLIPTKTVLCGDSYASNFNLRCQWAQGRE